MEKFLAHALGKLVLRRVAREIGECQHGNRWALRRPLRSRPRGRIVSRQTPHPQRPGDVLEILLAGVLEGLSLHAIQGPINRVGHDHRARFGEPFQPRGHVDPVPEDVRVVMHDVADVDANAKPDRFIPGKLVLQSHRAGDSLDSACELHEPTIPHALDDRPGMPLDRRCKYLGTQGTQSRECCRLVLCHQGRVTGDIGGKDRCKTAHRSRASIKAPA